MTNKQNEHSALLLTLTKQLWYDLFTTVQCFTWSLFESEIV